MYLFKNALLNVTRSKGRNILIGVIILVITIGACIALTIRRSATTLVNSYIDNNKLEVSFTLDTRTLRDATTDEKSAFKTLDIEQIKAYGDSDYVVDYYYTLETSLASNDLEAVDYSSLDGKEENNNDDNRFNRGGTMQNLGDFRLTSYSDFSYLEDFIDGTKKITEGVMIEKDSTKMNIVISSELAVANDLKLNDTVTFYLPSDSTKTYTFTITGIYEDNSDVSDSSFGFMGVNAMNSRNQIYTNLTSINTILTALNTTTSSDTNNRMISRDGITAKFYLTDKDNLDAFKKEAYAKGLSTYYTVTTNEEQILSSLKPIQNLSSFSSTFLIVILIIGGLILGVINMINIRERKYEIGVLRAIGMSKTKLTIQ